MTLPVIRKSDSLTKWNRDQRQLIKAQICKDISDEELSLFQEICNFTDLNPFAKQIYATVRGKGDKRKMTVQIGIDGYRAIAQRSGEYAGSDAPKYDEGLSTFEFFLAGRGTPTIASVTVYRIVKGVRCGFTAEASWQEYSKDYWGNTPDIWLKKPALMLAKCAESLALRKAFSFELQKYNQNDHNLVIESDDDVDYPIVDRNSKDSIPESPPIEDCKSRERLIDVCDRLGIAQEDYKTWISKAIANTGSSKKAQSLDKTECDTAILQLLTNWGLEQNVWNHDNHCSKSFQKLLEESRGMDLEAIASAWYDKIQEKLNAQTIEAPVIQEPSEVLF